MVLHYYMLTNVQYFNTACSGVIGINGTEGVFKPIAGVPIGVEPPGVRDGVIIPLDKVPILGVKLPWLGVSSEL